MLVVMLTDDQLAQLVLSAQRRLAAAEAAVEAMPSMAARERLVEAHFDFEQLREQWQARAGDER